MAAEPWGDPPCRHTQYTDGCFVCLQWRGYTAAMRVSAAAFYHAQQPYRYALPNPAVAQRVVELLNNQLRRRPPWIGELPAGVTTRPSQNVVAGAVMRSAVTIPAKAERISLPVRQPCKYEGPVTLACRACNQDYKVRHCEHPEADWEFCARAATPIKDGQNCRSCPIYEKQGT